MELLAGKVMTIVMMKTTIADVTGMEETAVVVMLIQNTVGHVNALIQTSNVNNVLVNFIHFITYST